MFLISNSIETFTYVACQYKYVKNFICLNYGKFLDSVARHFIQEEKICRAPF
jgi:hypothetical protein